MMPPYVGLTTRRIGYPTLVAEHAVEPHAYHPGTLGVPGGQEYYYWDSPLDPVAGGGNHQLGGLLHPMHRAGVPPALAWMV